MVRSSHRRSVQANSSNQSRRSSRGVSRAVAATIEPLEKRVLLTSVVVNTLADSIDAPATGVVSLRDAIADANASTSPTNISFDPTVFGSPQTIVLTRGQLELNNTGESTTITGPAAGVTISGGNTSRVLQVDNSVTATISDVSIVNGYTSNVGGGIYNAGALTLADDTIANNYASYVGGGIYNDETSSAVLTLTGVTIADNTSALAGGGLFNDQTAVLTNVTVWGNDAPAGGGIVSNWHPEITTVLTNVTVSANNAPQGGGICNYGSAAQFTLANSIVAGNDQGMSGVGSPDADSDFNSLGNNLIGQTDGSSGWIGTDLTGTIASPLDAMLGSLSNNSGPTQTSLPLAGSPAIDAGNNSLLPSGVTADQRGLPRIANGTVDIGAVETGNQSPAFASDNTANFEVAANSSFTVITLGYPNANLSEAGTLPHGISFTNNGNGTATLSGKPAAGTVGNYTLTITGNNGIAPNATQTFHLAILTNENSWAAATSGDWDVASNWSLGHIPTAYEDALITIVGNYTVTHGQATTDWVNSITCNESLNLAAGTLSVASTVSLNVGSLIMAGGTLQGGIVSATNGAEVVATTSGGVLDGVTINCNLDLTTATNAVVGVEDGLTLNGKVAMGYGGYNTLAFYGSQTLSGNGSVVFGNGSSSASVSLQWNNTTLTIGPGITIVDQSASNTNYLGTDWWEGYSYTTLINQGTIEAATAGTLAIYMNSTGGTFINQGKMEATNGGALNVDYYALTGNLNTALIVGNTSSMFLSGYNYVTNLGVSVPPGAALTLAGTWTNPAGESITAGNGATLSLGDQSASSTNAWSNAGTITEQSATVNLGGEFTLADLGNFSRVGGTVNLTGTLDLLPVAPSGLSATAGSGYVTLNWTNNSSVATSFVVERSINGLNFSQVGTVAGNMSTFIDTAVTAGQKYYYEVAAVDAVGQSPYSNVASVTVITSSVVVLPGNTPSASPASVFTASGTLTLNNTTGSWDLAGGTIAGGTVTTTGGSELVATPSSGALVGVTINGSLDLTAYNSVVGIYDGLTLNGTATLGGGICNTLAFYGNQTLAGNGSVVFGNGSANASVSLYWNYTTLTIGSGITIVDQSPSNTNYLGTDGWEGSNYTTLINQGTIDAAAGSLTIFGYYWNRGTFINQGTIEATSGGALNVNYDALTGNLCTALINGNGSNMFLSGYNYVTNLGVAALPGTSLTLAGTWTNPAGESITASGGATLSLGDQSATSTNAWINAGTISATDSTVNLGGEFTLADLGSFTRLGGTVNLTGTLDLLPVAPSALTAIGGAGYVELNWTDNSSVATSYLIERSTDGVHFSQIGTVAGNATRYYDTGLTTGQSYDYEVAAYDVVGESPFSNMVAVTVGAGPGTNVGPGTATVPSGAGGTLALNDTTGTWNLVSGGTIAGGTVTTSGNAVLALTYNAGTLNGVIFDGNLTLIANYWAQLTIENGLTLIGTVTFAALYNGINFAGSQTFAGNAAVVFANGYNSFLGPVGTDATLTIGPGITIEGESSTNYLGTGAWGGSGLVINQGTIVANTAGSGLIIDSEGGSFVNQGTISATNGGSVTVNDLAPLDGNSALTGYGTGTLDITSSLVGNTTNGGNTANGTGFNPLETVLLGGRGTQASPQELEVMSTDVGNVTAGYTSFVYGALEIGNNNYVQLVDLSHNSGGNASVPEALYCVSVSVAAGSTLDLNGLHLYAGSTNIQGAVVNGTITLAAVPLAAAAVTGNGLPIADGAVITNPANGTDFGSVLENSTGNDETYTITNTGIATLFVGSVNVPAGYSVIAAPPGQITAHASASFTVELNTGTVGTFAGAVSFATSDWANNPYDFAITGNVTWAAAVAAVYFNSLPIVDGSSTISAIIGTDFGSNVQGGTPVDYTYTISNLGNVQLTLGAITVPSGFSLLSTPAGIVAAGNSTTFAIGLSTLSPGNFSGDVSFGTNDPTNDPYYFAISGTITQAPAPITATAAVSYNGQAIADGSGNLSRALGTDFGSLTQGGPTAANTFIISNNGQAVLTLGAITLPTGFSLTGTPAGSVAIGGWTSFTIGLGTTVPGTFTGYVNIPTNDPRNNPYIFEITGTVSRAIAVTPPGNQIVTGGQSVSIPLGSFAETYATGPYNVDVNWGDGSLDTKFSVTTVGALPAKSHIYAASGNDTVSVTVSDAVGHVSNTATFMVTVTPSATLGTLASFAGINGNQAQGGLLIDAAGDLFGTTNTGGTYGDGTVFEIVAGTNNIVTLASFNGTNGANPHGGLIADANGDLFGTTSAGGANGDGTIFELVAGNNTINTLATFNGTNGANADPHLLLIAGNLYGTTAAGGASGKGTLFELPAGNSTINTLVTFNGTNGAGPSGLSYTGSNTLYGTTAGGGHYGNGTIFAFNLGNSTLTTLAAFNVTNGAKPHTDLRFDSAGNMYGTTQAGGTYGDGTVFEFYVGNGTVNDLLSFNGTDGSTPLAGLAMDAAGNLYGTTSVGGDLTLNGGLGDGTVFKIYAGNNTLSTLWFEGTDGADPLSGGVADAAGNLYGTTYSGGLNGDGTVFEVSNSGFVSLIITPPATQTATTAQSTSFNLGSFTESNAPSPYNVDVNWGDGTPDTISSVGGAGIIPAAAHTYASAGNDTVTITLTDSGNHTSRPATFTVSVAPAVIVLTPASNQTATPGQSTLLALGSFTQSNATGPFTVTVNWGDGTAQSIISVASAGGIPALNHTFSGSGIDTVTLTVTDALYHTSNSASFSVDVATTTIALTPPASQNATAGQSTTFNLGNFTQTNAAAPFTVTVNWGDGSAESIFIMATAGAITPTAHTYAAGSGNQTVTVTVTDSDNHTSNTASFAVSFATTPAWVGTGSAATWNAATQTLTVTGNATIIADPNTFGVVPIIDAGNGGQVVLDTSLAHIGGLLLQTGATLDIANDTLFINYGNGSSPLAAVQAGVQSGVIISSTANAGQAGQYTIGFADSTELSSIPSGNVELMFTLVGDAQLKGMVNFIDYSVLQNSYNQTGRDWPQGDFNHDGTVNFIDYSMLQNNYNQTMSGAISGSAVAAGAAKINRAAASAGAAVAASAPLYRLSDPATTNADLPLWTSDANEYNTLPSDGWTTERMLGYVL